MPFIFSSYPVQGWGLFLSYLFIDFAFFLKKSLSFDIFFIIFFIFQQSSNPKNITNPCYPKGFNTSKKASSIFESQCTKKPQNYDPNQELIFFGGGDSDGCGKVVKSIFDFKTCSSSQCSFNGVEQPPVAGDFLVTRSANITHESK